MSVERQGSHSPTHGWEVLAAGGFSIQVPIDGGDYDPKTDVWTAHRLNLKRRDHLRLLPWQRSGGGGL